MSDLDDTPRATRPRRPEDFDEFYKGTPPWDIGRPRIRRSLRSWRRAPVEAASSTSGAARESTR